MSSAITMAERKALLAIIRSIADDRGSHRVRRSWGRQCWQFTSCAHLLPVLARPGVLNHGPSVRESTTLNGEGDSHAPRNRAWNGESKRLGQSLAVAAE